MNGTIKIIIISFLASTITGAAVYYALKGNGNKIGVVDAVRLFDDYNMKKELEEKAKGKLQAMSKQVDSVENLLNIAKAVKNEEEIKRMTYACNYAKTVLDDGYKQSNQQINELVWKRLNAGMDAYGKAKGIHLVIGANGMGSVLYTDGYYDLTDDAIKFVNKRYEDGN